jgi:hypothetical protein
MIRISLLLLAAMKSPQRRQWETISAGWVREWVRRNGIVNDIYISNNLIHWML